MNIEHEDVQAMIANITTVVNRLPLKTKEDRLAVATFMLDMAYTTDPARAWVNVADKEEKADESVADESVADESVAQSLHEHTKSDSEE
jgi:hypothetical protein